MCFLYLLMLLLFLDCFRLLKLVLLCRVVEFILVVLILFPILYPDIKSEITINTINNKTTSLFLIFPFVTFNFIILFSSFNFSVFLINHLPFLALLLQDIFAFWIKLLASIFSCFGWIKNCFEFTNNAIWMD